MLPLKDSIVAIDPLDDSPLVMDRGLAMPHRIGASMAPTIVLVAIAEQNFAPAILEFANALEQRHLVHAGGYAAMHRLAHVTVVAIGDPESGSHFPDQ